MIHSVVTWYRHDRQTVTLKRMQKSDQHPQIMDGHYSLNLSVCLLSTWADCSQEVFNWRWFRSSGGGPSNCLKHLIRLAFMWCHHFSFHGFNSFFSISFLFQLFSLSCLCLACSPQPLQRKLIMFYLPYRAHVAALISSFLTHQIFL